MRSLRRAFLKQAGYQWVTPAADVDASGEDVRDSLAAVGRLAEEGMLRPFIWEGLMSPYIDEGSGLGKGEVDDAVENDKRNEDLEGCVFPFERASEAMKFVSGEGGSSGRTAVVKIVQ